MNNSTGYKDQRLASRTNSELPTRINIGTQLTFQGRLKDLSLKSAFIKVKESVFLQPSDEIGFAIQCSVDNCIEGMARVSRIVAGEGFAVYFTKIDESSMSRLRQLVGA